MEKIIQIMPVSENLYVQYNDGRQSKVVCIALTVDGEVLPMAIDPEVDTIYTALEFDSDHQRMVAAPVFFKTKERPFL
jgi:hypothetical protein